MKSRTAIIVVISFLIAAACGRSTAWPPNQRQLIRLFDRQKATLELIEQEMEADGILRMGPGIFSETARNPGLPKLPSTQKNKYFDLFDRTQVYLNVVRHRHATEFELLIQNDGPRLFLPRFVHTATSGALPDCSAAMEQMACGGCSVPLESDWLLEIDWFPASPDEEVRLC